MARRKTSMAFLTAPLREPGPSCYTPLQTNYRLQQRAHRNDLRYRGRQAFVHIPVIVLHFPD